MGVFPNTFLGGLFKPKTVTTATLESELQIKARTMRKFYLDHLAKMEAELSKMPDTNFLGDKINRLTIEGQMLIYKISIVGTTQRYENDVEGVSDVLEMSKKLAEISETIERLINIWKVLEEVVFGAGQMSDAKRKKLRSNLSQLDIDVLAEQINESALTWRKVQSDPLDMLPKHERDAIMAMRRNAEKNKNQQTTPTTNVVKPTNSFFTPVSSAKPSTNNGNYNRNNQHKGKK